MNDEELLRRLSTLLQMDRDAVRLYEEAARTVGESEMGAKAHEFQGQHRSHAQEIENLIRGMGREPRKPTEEFESIMRLHMESIVRAERQDETLITMRMAERIMNLEYAEILEMQMPEEIRQKLQRNLDDERAHLQVIEDWLERNVGVEVGVYL